MKNGNGEIKAVLFDLDGTLLDTAPDLAAALNELRKEQGMEALAFDVIRPQVSHGAVALVRLGFPQVNEMEFERLRERFLQLYLLALVVHTQPFPGFPAVLDALEGRGLLWGVVTNKAGFLTEPLLQRLELSQRCACIVSGDTLPHRKPHPAQMFHAAELMGVPAESCVYVGDAQRDVQAGRAAGMRTLVATFGYLGEEDRPQTWEADALLKEPAEILDWLDRHRLETAGLSS